VTVSAQISAIPPGDASVSLRNAATITVNPNVNSSIPGKTAYVADGIGGKDVQLGPKDGVAVASHELGHNAGAGDQYVEGIDAGGQKVTVAPPNSASSVMSDLGGPANTQTMTEIIDHQLATQCKHMQPRHQRSKQELLEHPLARSGWACAVVLLTAAFASCAGAASTAPASSSPASSAPVRVCEFQRGAYCIQKAGLTLKEEREPQDTARRVTISGYSWPDNPAIIIEPAECASIRSDTVQLLDYAEEYEWRGQLWRRISVRLDSWGRCDLVMLTPGPARDKATMGYWFLLTEVRACLKNDCSGPVLSGEIRAKIDAIRGQ